MGQLKNQRNKVSEFPKSFLIKDSAFSKETLELCESWSEAAGEQFIASKLASRSLTYEERQQARAIIIAFCHSCYSERLEKPGQWTPTTVVQVCLEELGLQSQSDEKIVDSTKSVLAVFFIWMGTQFNFPQAKFLYQIVITLESEPSKVQISKPKSISTKISHETIKGSDEKSAWAELFNQEITQEISYLSDSFPGYQLFRLLEHPQKSQPILHQLIQYAIEHHEDIDQEYVGHIYALFLLAEMKDSKAFALIMELLSLPGESLEILLGDLLAENLNQIVASVYTSDINSITTLIEDPNHYIWARNVGLQVLMVLVNTKIIERNWLVNYLDKLFDNRNIKTDPLMMGFVVNISCDLHAVELKSKIRSAYHANLVDEHYIQRNEAEEILSLPEQEVLNHGLYKYLPIEDAILSLKNTGLFDPSDHLPTNPYQKTKARDPQNHTFDHIAMKIGRNDLCLCGSGKKYKKCCLQ